MTHFDYTVFVAGATSGINLGIAQAFARAGARVAVASRSQDKGALDCLRKVRFPGLAGPDPIGAFLLEIADVIGRPSRN